MYSISWIKRVDVARTVVAIMASLFLYSSGVVANNITPDAGHWVVDPTDFGSDLPPVGRSLFDYLVTDAPGQQAMHKQTTPKQNDTIRAYNVPFPFEKLISKLDAVLEKDALYPLTVKQVLVPLGRSLARNHAAPDFFRYPRVVAVADTEPMTKKNESGYYFKDRLYIGYGEKSEILEVISYNEKAGRFEFQVVENYKEGGKPKVFYTNRSVCMSCHQNAAPIFSRQTWGETNANPDIARLLKKENKEFYGVSIANGIDIPFAIDEASDRANYFSYTQLLWQQGCVDKSNKSNEIMCRANAFKAALRYRLSGQQGYSFFSNDFQIKTVNKINQNWARQWPDGLLISDSDIPNRDPLLAYQGNRKLATVAMLDGNADKVLKELLSVSNIPIELEPLDKRPPLLHWKRFERAQTDQFITTLSEFMSATDVRRLDKQLRLLAARTTRNKTNYKSNCEFSSKSIENKKQRINFKCLNTKNRKQSVDLVGRMYFERGRMYKGSIDKIVFPDNYEVRDITINTAKINSKNGRSTINITVSKNGLAARRTDNKSIQKITFDLPFTLATSNWKQRAAKLTLETHDDAVVLGKTVSAMIEDAELGKIDAFETKPARRVALLSNLFSRLGIKKIKWCCENDDNMPTPQLQ